MSETFICAHCHSKSYRNTRLKAPQRYCGSKKCQQARKNQWERDRLEKDAGYRANRKAAKRRWYGLRPGDRYQAAYRDAHPEYREENRAGQQRRNRKRRATGPAEKIVKTDALQSKTLVGQGLYVLLPYEQTDTGKIVNTDALIVQMVAPAGVPNNFFPQNSG